LEKLTDEREGNMTKMVLTLACAAALFFALAEARAAEPEGGAPASKAGATEKKEDGEAGKSEEGEAGKDDKNDKDESDEGEDGAEVPPGGDGSPVPLAELTKDGFVIRTTNFIPADAVTRQSGKVASDAVIVTLQKSTSTAVCFYTLKAFVGKKLTTIAACTVHR
jgi:hypothetical protein